MSEKLQSMSMKYLIAPITAILFLTCFLPARLAYAENQICDDSGSINASMHEPEWIKLARPGGKSIFGKYTVTYHPNGGSGKAVEVPVDADKNYTIVDQGYSRENYIFSGWNTKPDGFGINYSIEEVISVTGDITLYARWRKVKA